MEQISTKFISTSAKSIFRVLSFHGVNRLFVSSFDNKDGRTAHTKYYLPTVEIQDYNVMIDWRNFFFQPVKINSIRYYSIQFAGQ